MRKNLKYPIGLLHSVLFFCLLVTGCKFGGQETIKVYAPDQSTQLNYALKKLGDVVKQEQDANTAEADLLIISSEEASEELSLLEEFRSVTEEGFMLKKLPEGKVAVIATDQTGVIYGIMELAEQLEMGKTLKKIEEKSVNPKYLFRAIKYDLPWNSYRVHESLQLHTETVRDLKYWESFLDMMAENRYNVLTLWCLHPFPYMIRPKNFPEACPFSDEELKSWQDFWHGLFGMAQERGIKTFMVNWNIFVSASFAEKHKVADYCLPEMEGKEYYGKGDYSEIVQRYNRECMTQLIDEYPEMAGFGISQNERMEGVEEQVWQNWIVDTYFDAMDSASRKIEIMLRAHTHPAPELTRKAIEDNAYRLDDVWVPVKFNWSHAHATPKLMYIHGGSTSTSLWDPVPENYKMVYTMRNEDFFVLRWGQTDFVRDVLRVNDKEYLGGYKIGSETYIPAKEYITKPGDYLTWNYAFEKQWLFYQVWGRLMYDPATKDEVFVHAFNKKYDIDFGDKLLEAHNLADKMPLKLASYYAATWDFTLYSEGFLAGYKSNMPCYYDSISPFISVDEIIRNVTLDTSYVSIQDFVAGNYSGADKITPVQLADELEQDGKKALALLDQLKTKNPTLIHEMDDIRTWAYLGLYFSEKLRGGMALQYFRTSGDGEKKAESISHLEKALEHWKTVVGITGRYMDEIPLLHLGDRFNNGGNKRNISAFSWKNLTGEVEYDIEIAKKSTVLKQ
ncbi:MAG: hypothetical protein R6X09_12285 [Bacteroidales bacterium]